MTGCASARSRLWYSTNTNKKRKLPQTLELIEVNTDSQDIVCVNTHRANQLVAEAIADDLLFPLRANNPLKREWSEPGLHGRFDFGNDEIVIEVKNVTWNRSGVGCFPDALSERATRHVQGLTHCLAAGKRAILFFCVPHTGIKSVDLATDIDPKFANAVLESMNVGLEVYAYRWSVSPHEFYLDLALPLAF